MKLKLSDSWQRFLFAILLATALLRILTLGAYPLADRTESRYGEIARKMLETGDWITPQIDYGVPFWGKPPLSTWLTAGSFKILNVNDFSARFSSFALIFIAVLLVYFLARQRGLTYALTSSTILATTAGFFVSSGAVMTDPALVLGTTLSMVGFWQAVKSPKYPNYLWGYLFFTGLAIGLLSKGPVSIVLTCFPIALWLLWQRKLSETWRSIPWLSGTALMLLIALPWYVLAETKTPGFIDYFIVGEHWKRFTESGWEGDLYGSGHAHPYGMIWLYWLLAAFPWSFLSLALIIKTCCNRSFPNTESLKHNRDWIVYLFVWTITPMIVFTFASNILWTYVLPGLPAFALLMTEFLFLSSGKKKGKLVVLVALIIPLTFLFAFPAIVNIANKNSQKYIIDRYYESCDRSECQLVYSFDMPYSAEFYSGGKAIEIDGTDRIAQFPEDERQAYFVVKTRKIDDLPEDFSASIEIVDEYNGYTLFRAN